MLFCLLRLDGWMDGGMDVYDTLCDGEMRVETVGDCWRQPNAVALSMGEFAADDTSSL